MKCWMRDDQTEQDAEDMLTGKVEVAARNFAETEWHRRSPDYFDLCDVCVLDKKGVLYHVLVEVQTEPVFIAGEPRRMTP